MIVGTLCWADERGMWVPKRDAQPKMFYQNHCGAYCYRKDPQSRPVCYPDSILIPESCYTELGNILVLGGVAIHSHHCFGIGSHCSVDDYWRT